MSKPTMTGAELIALERRRQVEKEGFDGEHDRSHHWCHLARAGACYAAGEQVFTKEDYCIGGDASLPHFHFTNLWPWECRWYNPKEDNLSNLVRAGALIAAAIDRLQAARLEETPDDPAEV